MRGGAGAPSRLVEVRAGTVAYRVAGDFTRDGKQAAAPLRQIRFDKPLAIMKHQVSAADYQRCVDDGACRALDRGVAVAADRPAGAGELARCHAYAAWLSRKTGERYRLPTDEEWAFAAAAGSGTTACRSTMTIPQSAGSPATSAKSERNRGRHDAARLRQLRRQRERACRPRRQCLGMDLDLLHPQRLDDAGETVSSKANCGVRVVEGQHRAYVTDFISDARAGGCAAGVPPDNLGFRLVREPSVVDLQPR